MKSDLSLVTNVASRHGLLDRNGLSRLNSPSDRTFWGFVNELKVAAHLESLGVRLRFHPRGAGASQGEFLAQLPTQNVFVEVKTMFPRPDEDAKQRIAKQMGGEIEAARVPGLYSVGVHREAPDFSRRRFRHFLRTTVIPLARTVEQFSCLYRDPTGLTALVNYTPHDGKLVACMPSVSGWIRDSQYIRASVESALRQLPADGANMVVVCDKLLFSPAPSEFIEGLFHEYKVSTGEGLKTRPPFLSNDQHRRVSAVAQFDTAWDVSHQRDIPFLNCYHHPNPRVPIDADEWKSLTRSQYRPPEGWLS